MHRFPNEPVRLPDGLHWDVVRLYREILAGLRSAGDVRVGRDRLVGDRLRPDRRAPARCSGCRTLSRRPDGSASRPGRSLRRSRASSTCRSPRSTSCSSESAARLAAAGTLLLMPDLLGFWLTGRAGAERTNASTTALYDARTGQWSDELLTRFTLPRGLLPPLREPGDRIGQMLPHTGLDLPVVAVASHDTASAVLAVPATTPHFAYISSGTWSLTGVELDAPVLDRREPGRELHQRGRHRRHHPLPAQRDGSVAAAGMPAHVGRDGHGGPGRGGRGGAGRSPR